MKCAHGLWPRGGAGAQPPRHQGRSCGAGPATGRQWFPGVPFATQCLTDMLLPESSSSWEVATPSFQCLRLQTSDSVRPKGSFFPKSPTPLTSNVLAKSVDSTCRMHAESDHLSPSPPSHPVPAYVCSAAPPTSRPLHTGSHRKSEDITSSPHPIAKSVP